MTKFFSEQEIKAIVNQNFFTKLYYKDEDKFGLVRNFQVRDDDVFLLGYGKSGTTWAQEMIWIIGNDFDYEGAKVFIDERFPVLEVYGFFPKDVPNVAITQEEYHWDSLHFAEKMKSPRFLKSHLTATKLPMQLIKGERKPKIIYIARNVKDVCVSFYHYLSNYNVIYCSFEDFCKIFLSDINPLGKYWESVLYFWDHRNEDNILFIKYEEMKDNLLDVIQKVAKFLNKPLTNEMAEELKQWLDFNSMKNNPAVNHANVYKDNNFIRKGKIGEHKKEMSPEMINKFDLWIKESLKDSDYEL